MSLEIPTNSPDKREAIDDNALKFTLDHIDSDFLTARNARSYLLTTDWLETGETSEKKLAHKKYANGDIETLLIQKTTDKYGDRTVLPKQKLSLEQYDQLLEQSVCHVEKKRHEFTYTQHGILFSMKYDEFTDSGLRVLEVDAATESDRASFTPNQFPYELTNVTGEIEYYGYRIADLV